jgi:hypothetical protein
MINDKIVIDDEQFYFIGPSKFQKMQVYDYSLQKTRKKL